VKSPYGILILKKNNIYKDTELPCLYSADVKHMLEVVYQISFSLQYATGYKIFISEPHVTTFVQNQIFFVLAVQSRLPPLNSLGTCKY
jgi:hypothetical protein